MGAEIQSSSPHPARVPVISLGVDVCSHASAIAEVDRLVQAGSGGYVCFSTVHMVMESHDRPEYGKLVNGADLVIPDGMPLVWMQKLQGRRDASRVRANDLMVMLCGHAELQGMSVGFYGGRQEVIDAIVNKCREDFPKLNVVYAFSPPFRPLTDAEDSEITAEIAERAPDILFMGLGCPKQEIWMAAHTGRLRSVMLGVGASFDFYAGNVRESPAWMGRLGLEWLYRLTQEPKRLWRRYLILNPRFIALAVRQLLQRP